MVWQRLQLSTASTAAFLLASICVHSAATAAATNYDAAAFSSASEKGRAGRALLAAAGEMDLQEDSALLGVEENFFAVAQVPSEEEGPFSEAYPNKASRRDFLAKRAAIKPQWRSKEEELQEAAAVGLAEEEMTAAEAQPLGVHANWPREMSQDILEELDKEMPEAEAQGKGRTDDGQIYPISNRPLEVVVESYKSEDSPESQEVVPAQQEFARIEQEAVRQEQEAVEEQKVAPQMQEVAARQSGSFTDSIPKIADLSPKEEEKLHKYAEAHSKQPTVLKAPHINFTVQGAVGDRQEKITQLPQSRQLLDAADKQNAQISSSPGRHGRVVNRAREHHTRKQVKDIPQVDLSSVNDLWQDMTRKRSLMADESQQKQVQQRPAFAISAQGLAAQQAKVQARLAAHDPHSNRRMLVERSNGVSEMPDPEAAEYLAKHESEDLGTDVLNAAVTHYNGTQEAHLQPASTDSHATTEEHITEGMDEASLAHQHNQQSEAAAGRYASFQTAGADGSQEENDASDDDGHGKQGEGESAADQLDSKSERANPKAATANAAAVTEKSVSNPSSKTVKQNPQPVVENPLQKPAASQQPEEEDQTGFPWYAQFPPPDFPHWNLTKQTNLTLATDLAKAKKAEEARIVEVARRENAAKLAANAKHAQEVLGRASHAGSLTVAEMTRANIAAEETAKASVTTRTNPGGPGDGGEVPPGHGYIFKATGNDKEGPAVGLIRDLWQKRSEARIWMSHQEASLIESHLTPNDVMLEYGAGYSTMWFSQFVKEYYSIEHNETWFDEMKAQINSTRKNVHLQVAPVTKGYKGWGGGFEEGTFQQFEHYIKAVDNFKVNRFDKVLIDGRARASCAEYMLKYLHLNSLVFIHDYQDRYFYHGIAEQYYYKVAETYEGQSLIVLRPKPEALKKVAKEVVAQLASS